MIEDIETAHRALIERGVISERRRQIAEVDGKPIYLAVCSDSEGNLLGLIND